MRTSWSRWWAGVIGVAFMTGLTVNAQARLPTREEAERLDEGTALTLGGQVFKLGVLAFDYGITDRINVGTDPPMYLLRSVESVLVPNLHVKVIAYQRDRLWLTGQAAVYYATVSKNGADGTIWAVPLTAFASYQFDQRWWLHGDVTYNIVWGTGAGDLSQTTLGGAAATRNVQVGAIGQFNIRPTIAITLMGRLQAYTSRLALSGSTNPDAFTSVSVDARINPRNDHPWEIVPGVSFMWQRIRLSAGVGYGNYFLPGMDIALTERGIVPQASFSVVL